MVAHYEILHDFADELFAPEKVELAHRYLDLAIEATDRAVDNYPTSPAFLEGRHVSIRKEYLNALIRSDTRRAIEIIKNAESSGIALEEIYEDILMAVMHEVGELWHQS